MKNPPERASKLRAREKSPAPAARLRLASRIAVACFAIACTPAEAPRPNIVLISLDTTRADHTSVHGYALDTTPNLVALAAGGTRFDVAYAPTSTTGPTHASIFTSTYPRDHGVIKNGIVLSEAHSTFAEVVRDAGYQTAGVVSSFVLDEKFGYAQGFDTWDDEFDRATARHELSHWEGHNVLGGFDRPGKEVTDNALSWLDAGRRSDAPFLLFLHYFDAHGPASPPERFLRKFWDEDTRRLLSFRLALYDAGIAYADFEIGRFLSGLARRELEENTIVVVFGDHGEGLMQHGIQYHGEAIYEEQVRVPFVVRWPGRVVAGAVIDAPIELLDVAPTLFDLIGIERPPSHQHGRSLAHGLLGHEAFAETDRAIPLYRRHFDAESGPLAGEHFGLRRGRWKYIDAPKEGTRELFDLQEDPGELRNLAGARMDIATEMQQAINAFRASRRDSVVPEADLSEADRARLKALGYSE